MCVENMLIGAFLGECLKGNGIMSEVGIRQVYHRTIQNMCRGSKDGASARGSSDLSCNCAVTRAVHEE